MDILKLVTAVRDSGDMDSAKALTDALLAAGGMLPFEGGKLVVMKQKDRKRYGTFLPGKVKIGRFAIVKKNESIELFGCTASLQSGSEPRVMAPYRKTFKLGEMAEYHAYNFSYYGPIRAISEKGVTISKEGGYGPATSRLDLEQFDWRNYDFDSEKACRQNFETSLVI